MWVTHSYKFLHFRLPDGSLMDITKVYPLDAVFDNLEDVPEDVIYCRILRCFMKILTVVWLINKTSIMQIKANKRYAGSSKWTVQVHLHWTHIVICCMNNIYKTLFFGNWKENLRCVITGYQQLVMLCKNSICDPPSFGTVIELVNLNVFYICVISIKLILLAT